MVDKVISCKTSTDILNSALCIVLFEGDVLLLIWKSSYSWGRYLVNLIDSWACICMLGAGLKRVASQERKLTWKKSSHLQERTFNVCLQLPAWLLYRWAKIGM